MVPYLKAIKRESNNETFTVFLKDPRIKSTSIDLIWAPWHDKLRGDNVLVTLTAPHTITAEILSELRAAPLPEALQNLPAPHIGLIIGNPLSRTKHQTAALSTFLNQIDQLKNKGESFWVVSSRRTPEIVIEALKQHLEGTPHWIWEASENKGDNPYKTILARADRLAVTADSHNMVGETLATGTPVYPIIPHAINPKLARFIKELKKEGYLKNLNDAPESGSYTPLDATAEIAATIKTKMEAHKIRLHDAI